MIGQVDVVILGFMFFFLLSAFLASEGIKYVVYRIREWWATWR
jgi:hypothetical protein